MVRVSMEPNPEHCILPELTISFISNMGMDLRTLMKAIFMLNLLRNNILIVISKIKNLRERKKIANCKTVIKISELVLTKSVVETRLTLQIYQKD